MRMNFLKKTSYMRVRAAAAGVMLAFMLSGCNSDDDIILAEGTEDEQLKLVAEYAAGVLLKYDRSHSNGLTVAVPEIPIAGEPVDISEPLPEETAPDMPGPSGDIPGQGPEGPQGGPEPLEGGPGQAAVSIGQALGIPEFDVVYTGSEIKDSYPDTSVSEDVMLFSLQAEPGEKLLILHFDLANNTGADLKCSPIESDVKIRLMINESERLNQQMTILMNDLKSFDDTIASGESRDTVLVFYLDDTLTDSIETMSLLIIGPDGESTFPLV